MVDISICLTCCVVLNKNEQPVDTIVNFQYYVHDCLLVEVRTAFQEASIYELQLVAACQATVITHIYSKEKLSRNNIPQWFNRENIIIIPQEVGAIESLIPLSPDNLDNSICILFVGTLTKPTSNNIHNLYPFLVSKSCVHTMCKFLT